MTRAVIVQARYGSSRLPGKVLLPLGRGTVLAEVLRRCRAIPGIDAVCCAVPHGLLDDVVAEEAAAAGAIVVRGSEQDVLDRYTQAARQLGADRILRVTSDCPLIDPALCGQVLALLDRPGIRYGCNNMPPSFPHGLDCEAVRVDALEQAWREATAPDDREHVTPFIRRGPADGIATVDGPGGAVVPHRWTLDHPEDYVFIRRVFQRFPGGQAVDDWRAVLEVASAPDLVAINLSRRQR
jgi:spore coat polysaccharide biosynthesis protein SpsF (cytidylyltransferase family)